GDGTLNFGPEPGVFLDAGRCSHYPLVLARATRPSPGSSSTGDRRLTLRGGQRSAGADPNPMGGPMTLRRSTDPTPRSSARAGCRPARGHRSMAVLAVSVSVTFSTLAMLALAPGADAAPSGTFLGIDVSAHNHD